MTLLALAGPHLQSAVVAGTMLAAPLSAHDRRLRLFLVTTAVLLLASVVLTLRVRRQLGAHRREEDERRRSVTFADSSTTLRPAADPWADAGLPEVHVSDGAPEPPVEAWMPDDVPLSEPVPAAHPEDFTVSWWDDPIEPDSPELGGPWPDDQAPGGPARMLADPDGEAGPSRWARGSRSRRLLFYPGLVGVTLLVHGFVLRAFVVPTDSMLPTIEPGDRVVVNQLSYRFHQVNRGDIVVVTNPEAEVDGVGHLIKRVVALPGERVEARDSGVVIDGRALREPYLDDGVVTSDLGLQTVPSGHYLLLGDNREVSADSRVFGSVARSRIRGRAFLRVWPLRSVELL